MAAAIDFLDALNRGHRKLLLDQLLGLACI
jgi:hypothetical protein